MAATKEPPTAPAAPPPTTPEATPTPELHVTQGSVIDRGPAAAPPKPGSAKERLFADLRKKVAPEGDETPPVPKVTPKTKQAEPPKPVIEPEDENEPTEPAEPPVTPEEKPKVTPATEPKDKKRVNPWKVVDEYKARVSDLEKQIADAKTTGLAEQEKKQLSERITALEQQVQAAENELRFTDYSKSQEFQEKYEKPYTDAWGRWMGELGELTVQTSEGERPIAPEDLLELVNLPLGKAREHANEVFGEFADDVMAARKEIRNLFDAQNKALADAKKNGAQRAQEQQQSAQRIHQEVSQTWTKANADIAADPKFGEFFKPMEGDEDGNTRLQKGFALADRAFSMNSLDPRLSPEQRAEVVRVHAAVRNRAAAFGRLVNQNRNLKSDVDRLKAELAKYQDAEPGKGDTGTRQEAPTSEPSSARDRVMQALRSRAQ